MSNAARMLLRARAMTRPVLSVLIGLMAAACGSTSSGGPVSAAAGSAESEATSGRAGAADSSGGTSGSAGSAENGATSGEPGGGAGGAGGRAGLGGHGGCGLCPAAACAPSAIDLQVTAPGASGGKDGVIGSIDVQASGVTLSCQRAGCGFVCLGPGSLPDGSYSIELSAPGYQKKTLQIEVKNPTSCGCCGCCPFSTTQDVSLAPDGSPISGCCSDLKNDPSNCGSCGKTCVADANCAAGKCTPVFAPCVTSAGSYSSCSDYCQKQGKSCAAACGSSGTQSLEWWGQGSVNCGDTLYASNGTCDQNLNGFTGVRCCCAE